MALKVQWGTITYTRQGNQCYATAEMKLMDGPTEVRAETITGEHVNPENPDHAKIIEDKLQARAEAILAEENDKAELAEMFADVRTNLEAKAQIATL